MIIRNRFQRIQILFLSLLIFSTVVYYDFHSRTANRFYLRASQRDPYFYDSPAFFNSTAMNFRHEIYSVSMNEVEDRDHKLDGNTEKAPEEEEIIVAEQKQQQHNNGEGEDDEKENTAAQENGLFKTTNHATTIVGTKEYLQQRKPPPPRSTFRTSSKLHNREHKKHWFVFGLVTISGIIEAICNRKFGCHANMMTGNTVKCMDALAAQKLNAVLKLSCVIVCYILGGAIFFGIRHLAVRYYHLHYSVLLVVARIACFCFGCSDLIARNLKPGFQQTIMRLMALSLGWGMINAAANEQLGFVTFAVTNHYTEVGLGTAEYILFGGQFPGGWHTSMLTLVAFLLSLFCTNIAQTKLQDKPHWNTKLPPLGMSLGIMYYLLFSWYSLP